MLPSRRKILLPGGPVRGEEGEGPVVEKPEVVVGSVAPELDPGCETFRTKIEILAFHATDRDSRMSEDVLQYLKRCQLFQ